MTVKIILKNGEVKKWRWRNSYVKEYDLESTKRWTRLVVFFRKGKPFSFGGGNVKTITIDKKEKN